VGGEYSSLGGGEGEWGRGGRRVVGVCWVERGCAWRGVVGWEVGDREGVEGASVWSGWSAVVSVRSEGSEAQGVWG